MRDFVGRTRELGQIRSALDARVPTVLRVEGLRGMGKTRLVLQAISAFEHLVFRVPALPEALQIGALAERVGPWSAPRAPLSPTPSLASPTPAPVGWAELFGALAERARPGRAPFVLVLDDVHRLSESRAAYREPLLRTLRSARGAGRPFHVVLVGPRTDAGLELGGDEGGDGPVTASLALEPLPFRHAARLLPGGGTHVGLRAYGMFGGIPRVLGALDPTVTLGTNLRRLLLDPDGPLFDLPGHWLERDLQVTSRYNAVLRALASGEREWGELHPAVPDLGSAGQLAPYLRRLETLGLVTVRRSLDAAPASRARRYAASDPFFAFWYRFVLPLFAAPPTPSSVDAYIQAMRGGLDEHCARMFPRICRQHMRQDAIETLGANARECGSLWGHGYDIPVAGVLTSGPAFYARCAWRTPVRDQDPFGNLDAEVRETRYGFGREYRLRVLFTRTEPPRWLERDALRRDQTLLIGPDELVGGA